MKIQDLQLCAEQGCDEAYLIGIQYCPNCLSEQSIRLSNLGFGMNLATIPTLEIVDSFQKDLENYELPLFL